MGILSKKPRKNKLYSLQKAMEYVNNNEGYSVVAENGGYRIIPDSQAREHIERYKEQIRQRQGFVDRIQTGFTPTMRKERENSNYWHRYGYYEEER